MVGPFLRAAAQISLCAGALVLAGCGGSSGEHAPQPDPLAAYKNQEVAWGSCQQYFGANGDLAAQAAKLGSRLKCADIKAPLDYQNPDGLQILLSMLRVEAADSPETKPNLFFNPGGPGVDGQRLSLIYSLLLSNASSDSVLGRKYKEVSGSLNFVGFSPRGVGASTRIVCTGNELVYQIDTTRWGDDPANIRKLTDSARYAAQNCQKSPLADYIHTEATARDMDLMRHLLGDEKLHYYGVSYGTWLGFWYAGIFPDRVGPMVLDSNMNFSRSIHDASMGSVNGRILTFEQFVAPYLARHDDVFHMGTTAEAIIADVNGTAGLGGLGHEVSRALLDVEGFRVEPSVLPGYIGALKAALETQRRIGAMSLDAILDELTQGRFIDDDRLNLVFRQRAKNLIDRMREQQAPNFYTAATHFALDNSGSVWSSVVCNDEPLPYQDEQFWIDKGFELAGRTPIAGINLAYQPCLYWNRKAKADKPSMESLKEAPLLMVQSQFDVPTPLSGAVETFGMLPGAAMVRIDNEGAHGLMIYQTECVDLTVMDYMLGKTPARRLTECEGKRLPHDPAPQTLRAQAAAPGAQPSVSNFVDPDLADRLIAKLREAVGHEQRGNQHFQ